MRIMHILSALVLHMFFPNRQCQCDLYVISTTLYRSYDVQLSFHTLFTQTHIVNAIYMLYAHIHIICYVSFTFLIYLITCNLVSAYCLHTHMSSAHHLYVICTATHGQHGPWTIFYCDRNLLLNGICGRNVELFHFRIMYMICEIICVAGFLCMSNLDIVHISSAYVHVICILSEHMCIMRILSAVVLDIFLPNRQCQCHPLTRRPPLSTGADIWWRKKHVGQCRCAMHILLECFFVLLILNIKWYKQFTFA